MELASMTKDVVYGENKPAIQVMLNSDAGKEIRIAFKKGQEMKEHKAGFPITVMVFQGSVDFVVNGEKHVLNAGDLITLKANVPHNLFALEDSLVRLSLNTADSANRVQNAVNQ